jgi:alkylated DNA repair protein alkB homolog 8
LNDYLPGQGIPPHVDTHSPFEEVFVSLSLKSGVTMHFKTPENVTKDLFLKPRSLVIFSGEVRYNWLHSIATRKLDKISSQDNLDGALKFRSRRVSLTLRKVKKDGKPCECKWAQMCDSQNKSVAVTENLLGGEAGHAPVYQPNNE